MSKETNQDMGTGSVKKLMVQMAVPAVVGQVINLLYNVVDRIYIGHIPEIGGAALTGVGLFTPILMLITAFAMLAGAGGAPRAAIAMGKGDRDTAEKIVANCFTVLLLLSVVLTGVFYGTLPTLVRLFGGQRRDAALRRSIRKNLCPWQRVRAGRDGHEPLHHHPGLRRNQYADHRHRRGDQHCPRPHFHFRL